LSTLSAPDLTATEGGPVGFGRDCIRRLSAHRESRVYYQPSIVVSSLSRTFSDPDARLGRVNGRWGTNPCISNVP
ncbi:hypothetical protein ACLOJK_037598, partial [Asimina triloba]